VHVSKTHCFIFYEQQRFRKKSYTIDLLLQFISKHLKEKNDNAPCHHFSLCLCEKLIGNVFPNVLTPREVDISKAKFGMESVETNSKQKNAMKRPDNSIWQWFVSRKPYSLLCVDFNVRTKRACNQFSGDFCALRTITCKQNWDM